MRYVHFSKPGNADVMSIKEGPLPRYSDEEVLIQVKAAGVNRPDIAQRAGSYPPPPGASPVLGLEVSGIVVACGNKVTNLTVGDQVCALTPGGGYAEYCRSHATHCLPIPKGMSFIEAAGIPENYFTVYSNVIQRGRLQKGEIFLVHGGSSGIGLSAIQLAKALGAKVLTTAGSDKKIKSCEAYGADLAINYREKDFVTEILNHTQSKGVDLILDMVGGDYFSKNLQCLAPDGRLVQIAALQGSDVSLHLFQMMMKRITITGSTLRPQSNEAKGLIAQEIFSTLWPMFESQELKVIIDSTYPLEEVAMAHERMESSQHIGKIILDLA